MGKRAPSLLRQISRKDIPDDLIKIDVRSALSTKYYRSDIIEALFKSNRVELIKHLVINKFLLVNQDSTLLYAITLGKQEISSFLLDMGGRLLPNCYASINIAISNGWIDVVRKILETHKYNTSISIAKAIEIEDQVISDAMVQLLVINNVNIHYQDIFEAVDMHKFPIAQYLIDNSHFSKMEVFALCRVCRKSSQWKEFLMYTKFDDGHLTDAHNNNFPSTGSFSDATTAELGDTETQVGSQEIILGSQDPVPAAKRRKLSEDTDDNPLISQEDEYIKALSESRDSSYVGSIPQIPGEYDYFAGYDNLFSETDQDYITFNIAGDSGDSATL
jgi:hypothetical protein